MKDKVLGNALLVDLDYLYLGLERVLDVDSILPGLAQWSHVAVVQIGEDLRGIGDRQIGGTASRHA